LNAAENFRVIFGRKFSGGFAQVDVSSKISKSSEPYKMWCIESVGFIENRKFSGDFEPKSFGRFDLENFRVIFSPKSFGCRKLKFSGVEN
jgi:hypothetical protein